MSIEEIDNFLFAEAGGNRFIGSRRHELRHYGGWDYCRCIYDLRG